MLARTPTIGVVAGLAWTAAHAPSTAATGRADVAALQVALRAAGTYDGTVDGIRGPGTLAAVKGVQRLGGLPADGVVGPYTRPLLGSRGRHRYGSRTLRDGHVGWDVAALQFKLAAHGFPSGSFDGQLGQRSLAALRRFQRWAGLPAAGVAGPATMRALRAPIARSPVRLRWPLKAPVGDPFGPRGERFHAGIDLPAPAGVPVAAAGAGRVAVAGNSGAGWGNLVVVQHRLGVRTLYAHLSSVHVRPGAAVRAGERVGRVGQTGSASGPHLHFELLLRGANIDPASALH